ncbi:MAG: hypothetical protein ACE5OZ_02920 [Candidatus Heimdallarchaeota archaeon]
MSRPAIVVVAYNRIKSLSRLLSSLTKATYPFDIQLIISIDKGNNHDVQAMADRFEWSHGEKVVIYQADHLGLKNHILKCGDLTQQYESVIILEDDLLVSPMFYTYAIEALKFYKSDDRIAGLSLYSMSHNIYTRFPFKPILDESDTFFLQIPQSWGEVWNQRQWSSFREWYSQNNHRMNLKESLPPVVASWPDSSWAKYFWAFMAQTNRYFAVPRESHTTQFSETGIHTRKKSTSYHVPLQLLKKKYEFKSLDESIAVYDEHYELLPDRLNRLTNQFRGFEYEVDLNGTKQLEKITAEHCLTSKPSKTFFFSFGREMKPLEMNIIDEIGGKDLFFCRTDSIEESRRSKLIRRQKEFLFYYTDISAKRLALLLFLKIIRKI